MQPIKVMLVDDQKLMLEGLQTLLSVDETLEVVALAQSGEEALKKLETISADVLLLDIRMPGIGGVEATRMIKEKYPQVTILILTTFDDDHYIIDALRYGASGYLLKDIETLKLIESIKEALSGNLLLTGHVARKLAVSVIEQKDEIAQLETFYDQLTFPRREMEIVELIVKGYSSKEIADVLHLTRGTVKNYFSFIYSKIGTNDRAKAVLILNKYLERKNKTLP